MATQVKNGDGLRGERSGGMCTVYVVQKSRLTYQPFAIAAKY